MAENKRSREERILELSDDKLDERLKIARRRKYKSEYVAIIEAELRRRGYDPSGWYKEEGSV